MKYRLLALDIDGTLLTSRRKITGKTIRTLEDARKKGLQITLATGRNYLNTRQIAKKLKINLPVISNDGAYIVNPLNQEAIFEKRMVKESVAKIIQTLNQYSLRYVLHHHSFSISNRRVKWTGLMGLPSREAMGLMLYEKGICKIIPENEILGFLDENGIVPFKITVFVDRCFAGQLNHVTDELVEKFDSVMGISGSGYKGFEIIPKGMSKAKGLEILGRELNVDKSEIIAIGDSFNDIEMIKYAGLGIAMGNAPRDIQELAGFVTKSNDENGVAYAVERFYLNTEASQIHENKHRGFGNA